MSNAEPAPQAARLSNLQGKVPPKLPHASFWIRELPFSLVLILTILGVAYMTVSKQPIIVYWELLAPVIGLVCVGAGWPNANDKNARLLLICTQALHRVAFLLVMNLMLLPSVQRILNASATGRSILTLLALGTFTAVLRIEHAQTLNHIVERGVELHVLAGELAPDAPARYRSGQAYAEQ